MVGKEPSEIELDKCVAKMKARKAPGKDKFIADVLMVAVRSSKRYIELSRPCGDRPAALWTDRKQQIGPTAGRLVWWCRFGKKGAGEYIEGYHTS